MTAPFPIRRRFRCGLLLAMTALVGAPIAHAHAPCASSAARPRVLSAAQWRADLAQLRDAIVERHFKPFHAISRKDFAAEVLKLREAIPHLFDHAIVVRMAAIVASIGDGHTRLAIPEQFPALSVRLGHAPTQPPTAPALQFTHLPVDFRLFSDGLFVTGTDAAHAPLLGAKVLAVGDMPAGQALQRVDTVVSRDNDQTLRLLGPQRLALPQVLSALGITHDSCTVPLKLALPDGRMRTAELRPLRTAHPSWRTAVGQLHTPPLWLQHPDRNYWFRYLPNANAVYVQLNKIENAGDEKLAVFMAKTVALAGRHNARYILDLRRDSGGHGSLDRAVVLALVRSPRIDDYGRLYVLIGRRTFSAAETLVDDLEQYSQTIFVGAPTGASPSAYGDPVRVRLHHSGLTLRVATIFWHSWLADDTRTATPPTLAVPLASADYFSGRDPVLQKALAYRPPQTTIARVRALLTGPGVNSAAIFLLKYETDPRTASVDLSGGLAHLGAELRGGGDLKNSRYALVLGTFFYPDDSELYAQLGVTLQKAHKTNAARKALRKALRLNPQNKLATKALRALEDTRADPGK